jgi:hypothetical protein
LIRSLVQGPSAAPRRNRPAEAVRRRRTSEEDVRFACDCDIAFAIWEFAGPRLFIASLSLAARFDDDRALARRQKPVLINARRIRPCEGTAQIAARIGPNAVCDYSDR